MIVENRHKYIIKMLDPADWLRHYDEGTQDVNDFILPRGPRQQDEMSDTVYHKDAEVPYHQHPKGFETFEIARGSVECVVNGQHFVAQARDIIHLTPYTSHGFRFLEEGTIWRELFQEIDMSGGILEKNLVKKNYPEMLEDKEFMELYRAGKSLSRETPVPVDVPREQVPQVRTPDFAIVKYEDEGFSLKLKVGKWETNGCKEIWHADLKKGLFVDYAYPHPGYELLYVKSGKLEVKIMDETYIVEGDTLIDIPPYHIYSIRILEDAALYNYGGAHDLMAMLEDLRAVKQNDPQRIEKPEDYLRFLRKYGVYATDIKYQPE